MTKRIHIADPDRLAKLLAEETRKFIRGQLQGIFKRMDDLEAENAQLLELLASHEAREDPQRAARIKEGL